MTNPSGASFNRIQWSHCKVSSRVRNGLAISEVASKTLLPPQQLFRDHKAIQQTANRFTAIRFETVPRLSSAETSCQDLLLFTITNVELFRQDGCSLKENSEVMVYD